MDTSTYQHTPIFVNHQIPQPAVNERARRSSARQRIDLQTLNGNYQQGSQLDRHLELATKNVQLSDREIVIATEPEVIVIMGYAEFSDCEARPEGIA
ncbi:hypothetical protein [Pleurocapsa sp. FMAR1]|uniref:hypothetical protein n=1 Tax=Pleurocapsa sp. FMAR1 TaxID=3040204 RepID=UPI0029C745F1|nr:hypothetical protein [Pleurocapsa sp. FMAR1]